MDIAIFTTIVVIIAIALIIITHEIYAECHTNNLIIGIVLIAISFVIVGFAIVGIVNLEKSTYIEKESYDIVSINNKFYYTDEESDELHVVGEIDRTCTGKKYLVTENPHVTLREAKWLFLKETKLDYYVMET